MTFYLWLGFLLLVFVLLALDLGVFHKKDEAMSTKAALLWTAFWIALSLLFNVFIYFAYEHHLLGIGLHIGHNVGGHDAAIKYFTGYIIEKSLSLDNIFVIAMIFAYFRVPDIYQHRVLFWGILGALLMRGIMIAAGAALIQRFDWMIYVFGGLLILTALKMLFSKDEEIHPDDNALVKLARKLYPVTGSYEGHKFFTIANGKRAITPLFLVLLVIESTDVIFAVDSIPAIFAITTDPYIVFTSNVFAILGLRSLYFALAAMMNKFRYLKVSIVVVLIYVGVKMLVSELCHIPTLLSLGVILIILSVGVFSSIMKTNRNNL